MTNKTSNNFYKKFKKFSTEHCVLVPFLLWVAFVVICSWIIGSPDSIYNFISISNESDWINRINGILILLMWISIGVLGAVTAHLKGRSAFAWFFISLIFSKLFLIGFWVLALLDNIDKNKVYEKERLQNIEKVMEEQKVSREEAIKIVELEQDKKNRSDKKRDKIYILILCSIFIPVIAYFIVAF